MHSYTYTLFSLIAKLKIIIKTKSSGDHQIRLKKSSNHHSGNADHHIYKLKSLKVGNELQHEILQLQYSTQTIFTIKRINLFF